MVKAFTGLLRKKGDTLEYISPTDETLFKMFKESVSDNALVEIYMELQSDDGSLAQLAKIHAMIRDLCLHTGDSFEDMKLIIKKRAGICIEKELDGSKFLYCKSLGNCSKQELSLVIQALQEVSVLLEYPL